MALRIARGMAACSLVTLKPNRASRLTTLRSEGDFISYRYFYWAFGWLKVVVREADIAAYHPTF